MFESIIIFILGLIVGYILSIKLIKSELKRLIESEVLSIITSDNVSKEEKDKCIELLNDIKKQSYSLMLN